ncbi:PilZ domain-containing protein [Candidatus Sumerlaeota bacterium]|nr:PilZ domain-containing protein [Candidatus Sumerlaeota bacterium]
MRLTQVAVTAPITLNATVEEIKGGQVLLTIVDGDPMSLGQLRYMHEFLMRWRHDGYEDAPMVVVDVDPRLREMILVERRQNQREYQRVESPFPITYDVIDELNLREESSKIDGMGDQGRETYERASTDLQRLAEKIDQLANRFEDALAELRDKVDFLVAIAQGLTPEATPHCKGHMIDLSGSGFSFVADDARLKQGDYIRVHFDIHLDPSRRVNCIGEVVRVSASELRGAPPEQKRFGVHIVKVSEQDQDKIIRYVFAIERRILRLHRER